MYPVSEYYALIGFCPTVEPDRRQTDGLQLRAGEQGAGDMAHENADEPADLEGLSYDPADHAMMLDFDGTLVDIAATPDAVTFAERDDALLRRLSQNHGGALAIVSGRAIDDLDGFITDFPGAMAGGHGAELRVDGEQSLADHIDEDKLEQLKAAVRSFAEAEPRLLIEEKATGIVMHYRAHPDCEDKAVSFAKSLVDGHSDFGVQYSKMAVEIRPKGASKASAMEKLLESKPFAGRAPFFAGDDVTDEDAFDWVNAQGGISVRIGPGPTKALYRTPTPRSFKAWLDRAAAAPSN
ncbi:MAG: trehalose-phosphatase [Pseudomonadota bacterium]